MPSRIVSYRTIIGRITAVSRPITTLAQKYTRPMACAADRLYNVRRKLAANFVTRSQ